jgi:serine/threonine-protein kinase HipA
MPRTLDVYLHHHLIGHLIQDEHGQMVFDYAESWLQNPDAMPLSNSLPLRPERFNRNECRGFFEGILPEEGKRELIARNLGISARNDFAMLEQIGGECAGAVTFMPTGEALTERNNTYRSLTDRELTNILQDLPRRPLMAGEDGVRLSLAGAQDKIALYVDGDRVSIPLGNAPSSHILKPAIAHYEGLVFNEAFCMKLAKAIGLPTADVEIRNTGGIDYLLVERYDRKISQGSSGEKHLNRIHQEDFCQALGIVSGMKYQNEGGPSIKDCFDLVRNVSGAPVIDLQHLLDAVIFNFLIGNHDAHGKNFSLLLRNYESGFSKGFRWSGIQFRLAPLYDLVCTAYYPNLSQKMAMKIGGEYKPADIYLRHFERLADEAGFAKPLVRQRVFEIAEAIIKNVAHVDIQHPVADKVADFIKTRTQKNLDRFKA